MPPTSAEVKKWLKSARDEWGKAAERAKESGSGWVNLDDGRYASRLTGYDMGPSESSGRMQIVFSFTVIEGEQTGEIIKDFRGIDTEDGKYYLLLTLGSLGVDVDDFDPSKLTQILDALVEQKPAVLLQLKTRGDFQNKRIVKLLGDDYEADASGNEGEDAEDDAEAEDEAEEAEAEPEAEDEEEPEAKVGQIVRYQWQGDATEGEITELLEDEGKVKIRTIVDGKAKIRTVSAENVALVQDVPGEEEAEDEEEEEAPPEKPSKPTTKPAPVRRK